MKVFVSWPGYQADGPKTGQTLADAGHEVVLAPKLGARAEDEVIQLAKGCAGAIVSTDPFSARVLAELPDLRIIARVGVGYDSIDLPTANANGVAVSITPGMNTDTVADHTLALMLGLVRKVAEQDRLVKAGHWERVGKYAPTELRGKTVGLVGVGAIGQAVIRRLAGFGVKIIYFDDFVDSIQGAEKCGSFEILLRQSDIVSLHVPLVEATQNLIDAPQLDLMKSGGLLINTARGPVINQDAVFGALKSGQLGGAALDVYKAEPPSFEDLADIPNLICTAHLGGISRESIARMTVSATQSVIDVLSGKMPNSIVNKDQLKDIV